VCGQEGLPRTAHSVSGEAKDRNTVGVKTQERKERCFRKATCIE